LEALVGRVQLTLEIGNFGIEGDDSLDSDQGHAIVGHVGYALHERNVRSAVAALTAIGSGRLHDLFQIDPSKESGLDIEHSRNLADRVQRRMLVIKRQRHVLVSRA
jgi:hypothetical protein